MPPDESGEGEMKLYPETTAPNFLFADDAPEKQNATAAFFEWLKVSPDKLYTSELVFAELERTPEAALRKKTSDHTFRPRVHRVSDDSRSTRSCPAFGGGGSDARAFSRRRCPCGVMRFT
jgi:hypothetical protein